MHFLAGSGVVIAFELPIHGDQELQKPEFQISSRGIYFRERNIKDDESEDRGWQQGCFVLQDRPRKQKP